MREGVEGCYMFDKLVEQKIREAMRAGEFDRLEGAGRPVNLDAYFSTPAELRAAYAVLKNAGILPEEAQLLKEIDELKARLEGSRRVANRLSRRGVTPRAAKRFAAGADAQTDLSIELRVERRAVSTRSGGGLSEYVGPCE